MIKEVLKRMFIFFLIFLLFTVIINIYVYLSINKQIVDKVDKKDKYDAIIVLGASLWNNEPSPLLRERLDKAIELYNKGVSEKILMSGDHSIDNHDEVNTMKRYAIEKGVPSEDIFMDHAGFSTYESIYRAKAIFRVKKAVIVTQRYHLTRSIYISKALGVNAIGIKANNHKGTYNIIIKLFRDIREFIAIDKDFIKCIVKPYPTYLGEEIPITGNGNVTNDKKEE